MKDSQLELVKAKLLEDGYISRNFCLKNYISRLGAIIFALKKQGFVIEGKYEYYDYGKDFVYRLVGKTTEDILNKEDRCAVCLMFKCEGHGQVKAEAQQAVMFG